MLNISKHSVKQEIDKENLMSLREVESKVSKKVLRRMLYSFSAVLLIILFLPWTQTIQSNGNVTTLKPDQRPQTIHSIIAGRIEKWFVMEGDFVKKGDTILFISEIKDEYFDPNLLSRTEEQLQSKELSVKSYFEKVQALDSQIDALERNSLLKLEQLKNKLIQAKLKVKSDSIDLVAAEMNEKIAEQQFDRMKELYDQGLKSKTDLENRNLKLQEAQAKKISAENKMLTSQNEVINAKVDLNSIQAEYQNKISKAESDKFTALSGMYDAEAVVTKLQNQYMNYSVRTGMYYITAPQDGYVTKTIQQGIGETVKEGASIVSIMPADYELAIEMYIRPIDLPLMEKGQHVRIQFDGWPAIVFSGWPNTSYGTYGGTVYAIDNFISENGKYRVLVAPDPNDPPWPKALRVGSGTRAMVMLKDVPVWYELWRQINGFPPEYYHAESNSDQTKKEKK